MYTSCLDLVVWLCGQRLGRGGIEISAAWVHGPSRLSPCGHGRDCRGHAVVRLRTLGRAGEFPTLPALVLPRAREEGLVLHLCVSMNLFFPYSLETPGQWIGLVLHLCVSMNLFFL